MAFNFKKISLVVFISLFVFIGNKGASADNGEYKIDIGLNTGNSTLFTTTLTTAVGWNNFNVSAMSTTTVLSLVDSAGNSTSAQMYFSNAPECFANGLIAADYNASVTNTVGYPASVSTDYIYDGGWRCPSSVDSKAVIVFTGLNPAYTYTFKAFSANTSASPNIKATIGTTTATLTTPANRSNFAQINNVSVSATSSISIDISNSNTGEPWYLGAIELIANTTNVAPVVDAGSDIIITAPSSSVSITGTATDSDGTIASTTWELYSGPFSTITSPNSLSTNVTGMVPGVYTFRLYATDNFGKRVYDEKIITVRPSNYVSGLPSKKIVLLGSSTTFGWGSTPNGTYENSWAKLFEQYVKIYNPSSSVVNLGNPGYTISKALPTGSGLGEDTARNITAALAQSPSAVVINFTTNDANASISTTTSISYIRTIVAAARAQNVPVWITSPIGRNMDVTRQNILIAYRSSILSEYGTSTATNVGRGIDIWDPVTNSNGTSNATYGYGDNIHLNDQGHTEVYSDILSSNILATLYASTSSSPIITGTSTTPTSTTLTWSAPVLNGGLDILSYNIYNASNNTLLATTTNTTATFTGLTTGQSYSYYVTAINGVGESASSTIQTLLTADIPAAPTSITVTPGNTQALITWTTPVSDGGSPITAYRVYDASNNTLLDIASSTANTSLVTSLTNGTSYQFYVTALNAAGESASSTLSNTGTPQAPVNILNFTVTPSTTSAVLTWNTTQPSDSEVQYGTTLSYGDTVSNTNLTTSHSITLEDLTPDTIYYFQISSADALSNVSTTTDFFETTALPEEESRRRSSGGKKKVPTALMQATTPSVPTTNSQVPSVPSTPSLNSITQDLFLGVQGINVKLLQQRLNELGFTVAQSGPGSKGQETELFGALTKAAVIKFQTANNITPVAGYVGPVTRKGLGW